MKNNNKKGNSKSDKDSINFNNQVQRTITMWHGQVEEETKLINGKLMMRNAPSRGIRILTVHPSCNDDAGKIASNFGGFIPTPSQIAGLKWVEVPAKIEVESK